MVGPHRGLPPTSTRSVGRSTTRSRIRRDPFARRPVTLLVVYLLCFAAVATRLVLVQGVQAERWASLGEAQRARTIELPPQRGRIYDRDGDVLATSLDAATVYADPRAYRPQERNGRTVPAAAGADDVARRLAPILGADADALEAKLRRDSHFVYLARQLDHDVGERIRRLGLPGIGILTESKRSYPGGALAGQVVGFTGIDGDGLAGLELEYDGLLSGSPGTLVLERAPGGLTIASAPRTLRPPTAGTDLVVTIDREIQHVAERAARAAVDEHGAVGASVVVLEVGTGDVLAMASIPAYDPNRLEDSDAAAGRNRAVTDMYEPGSVQKAVTVAAALEEGIAGPQTTSIVADRITVANRTFSDDHDHPTEPMTLAEIVEQSSNVGTIMLGQQLGEQRLARYLRAFGYGQPLGLNFPGESAGAYLPVDRWSKTSLPTISIGYGVALTLVQAANIYATIANDGMAVQPRLVRGTVGDDGRLAPVPPPAEHRVVSARTAEQLRRMLGGVVAGERGTGHRAAVAGYSVGGKTGTARKALEGARGYSGNYIASFVGFAPVEDPQLVVAVMVDEPTPIYGGVVAAPVFREVMRFALAHRRVPPDRPAEAASVPAATPSPAG